MVVAPAGRPLEGGINSADYIAIVSGNVNDGWELLAKLRTQPEMLIGRGPENWFELTSRRLAQ